jgi:HEAT repeat protein
MQIEGMNGEWFELAGQGSTLTVEHPYFQAIPQERLHPSLALLLDADSDEEIRTRAVRRLAREGVNLLPAVLAALSSYPEITSPPWPWWPPQYQHCARLLRHYCREMHTEPDALLHHPAIIQPPGPVLWISTIEAAELFPHRERFELFFRHSLTAPWENARYAAAMALANLSGITMLQQSSLEALSTCLSEAKTVPLRLALAYALLRHQESSGLEELLRLLDLDMPTETRKAAAFVLATEPPVLLTGEQRARLVRLLLAGLRDQSAEIGCYAADALSKVAPPSIIPTLCSLLHSSDHQMHITVLTALEGMAARDEMRSAMQVEAIPALIAHFMEARFPEVRKQAGYTLAAIGGAYARAKLGTTILNHDHPGRIEAIESVRLLREASRLSTCRKIVGWLLNTLQKSQEREEVQVTALDSIAYLVWHARKRGNTQVWKAMSDTIWRDRTALDLLHSGSAWVRQGSIELLSMLDDQPPAFHEALQHLLRHDHDGGVRACAAYICGQMAARWAIADLTAALYDSDEHVAQTALNTLGRVAQKSDESVVNALKELATLTGKQKSDIPQLVRGARALLKAWEM